MHEMTSEKIDFGLAVLPKSMVRMDIGPESIGPMSMCVRFIQAIPSQNRRCRGSRGTWGTSAPYKAFGMLQKKNRGRGGEKKRGGNWGAYRGTTCPKCPQLESFHITKTYIVLIIKEIGILSTSGARSGGTSQPTCPEKRRNHP